MTQQQQIIEKSTLPPLPAVRSPADEMQRLKTLYRLSMTLSGDPVEVFSHVARMIGELLDVKVVCLSEVRGDELYFLSVYVQGTMYANAGKCDLAITPCSTVESTKDIRIYDRVMERFPQASFLKQHNAFSYCGFPALDNDGKVVAVTCLLDDRPHEFSASDQEMLRIFGQRIGLEIERQRNLQSREDAQRELVRYKDQLEELVSERTRQLHSAQSGLLRAERLSTLGRLTATVSHELRNPLGTIRNSFYMLKRSMGEVLPKVSTTVDRIERNIERCDRIIGELLEFARDKTLRVSEVSVQEWLNDVVEELPLPDGIAVRVDVAADVQAEFDEQLIRQVLVNVINNARDALVAAGCGVAKPSTINIRAERRNGELSIDVEDNGIGIVAGDLSRIFEPLHSTKNFGVGLGLPLVKQIVELHGGSVTVNSAEGQGTRVHIVLPASVAKADIPAPIKGGH